MKDETMNEHLINLDDYVIATENGETIGTLPENPETYTEDEVRIRAIVKQAFDEALAEVKKEYPYSGVEFLFKQFDNLFRAKCRERISDDGEYDAVIRYWEHVLNETVYAD